MKITFPPDDISEAGAWRNSRVYEAFPIVFPVFTYAVVLWCSVAHYFIHTAANRGDYDQANAMFVKFGGVAMNSSPYSEPLWKFLSACFLHGDIVHILFNMMWIITLGPLMERGLGTAKTILFVVAVGFVSSAMATGIEGRAIGMSGVVYAMAGFMWTAWPRWTGFLEKFRGQTVKFLMFWQMICFVLTFTGSMNISNVGHISGMIYGALIGQWACMGSKHGKPWMAASLGFTLLGVAFALKPLSAWFS